MNKPISALHSYLTFGIVAVLFAAALIDGVTASFLLAFGIGASIGMGLWHQADVRMIRSFNADDSVRSLVVRFPTYLTSVTLVSYLALFVSGDLSMAGNLAGVAGLAALPLILVFVSWYDHLRRAY